MGDLRPTPAQWATWAVLRIAWIEDVQRSQVIAGRYAPHGDEKVEVPDDTDGLEDLVAIARERFESGEKRRETVSGKVTILLAIVAGIAALVPAAMFPGPRGWGALAAGLCFVVAILLVMHFLGIRQHMSPAVDDELVRADAKERRKLLVRSYLMSAAYNEGATDYLVDVFRAALRFFVVGVVVAMLSVLLLPAEATAPANPNSTGLSQPTVGPPK